MCARTQARRKTNEEEELDALFTQYAYALSFFERWCKRGVEKNAEITVALNGFGEREQVWLRPPLADSDA